MVRDRYVHGYDGMESVRLQDQARTLEALLHADTTYPPDSAVLEAGCGVGAQTVALARNSPAARITAVDISSASLAHAQARVTAAGLANVSFQQADVFALPFADGSFDHVFVCFLLEHLRQPVKALAELRRVLKPGGTVTAIEGDHGSTFFHPDSDAAHAAIACLVELQRRTGGDALIGRRLYPLVRDAGFDDVHVSPRMVYVDSSKPRLVDGFIRKTFTAMVAGVRDTAIKANITTSERFDAGIAALHRTAEPDGTFCYTFFKATGRKACPRCLPQKRH
jgi:ubiquinone/menaquinone biosynthesis C-methylase UbiE